MKIIEVGGKLRLIFILIFVDEELKNVHRCRNPKNELAKTDFIFRNPHFRRGPEDKIGPCEVNNKLPRG